MRVATILAHPDDAELWAGGTLMSHVTAGDAVTVLTFADRASVRYKEAESGARILGAACEIRRTDLLFTPRDLSAELQLFFRSFKPDVVITHWSDDTHPDHSMVARATARASTRTKIDVGVPHLSLACDTYASLGMTGSFEPTLYVDITSTFDKKLQAIGAHVSQPTERWIAMAHALGALHGFRSNCRYAEAFRAIPVLGAVLSASLLPGPPTR